MRSWFALGVVLALGCEPAAVQEVTLSLRAGSCGGADLSRIRMLSVDVYGFDDNDQRCVLQQRCISEVTIAGDVEDPAAEVEALLRQQTGPLADTQRDGAAWIGISGRSVPDCFAPADVMCAFADLSDVADGKLDVALSCGDCTGRVWEYCP